MRDQSPEHISLVRRWLRFNLVGLIGIFLQLAMLFLLTNLGITYLWATGIAVELAVIHNWAWHERYTWSDRTTGEILLRLSRLAKFNVSNGGVSLLGNLLTMRLLVGYLRVPLLVANLTAVIVCSLVNFLLSDQFVFRRMKLPSRLRCGCPLA